MADSGLSVSDSQEILQEGEQSQVVRRKKPNNEFINGNNILN